MTSRIFVKWKVKVEADMLVQEGTTVEEVVKQVREQLLKVSDDAREDSGILAVLTVTGQIHKEVEG